MKIAHVTIGSIRPNPDSAPVVKSENFKKLIKNVQSIPWIRDLMPIRVSSNMTVLDDNTRLEVYADAGLKIIPVILVDPEAERAHIVRENWRMTCGR